MPELSERARLLLRVADLDGAHMIAATQATLLRRAVARALGRDDDELPGDDELIRLLTIRLDADPGEDP